MSAETPTIRPALLPLTTAQKQELDDVMATVNAGEYPSPRYYAVYRVLNRMPDSSSAKQKLLADLAKQEELTTSARMSVVLNGLYPGQYNFEPLFHPDLEHEKE